MSNPLVSDEQMIDYLARLGNIERLPKYIREIYEAARAKDQERIKELEEGLRECERQIEYLHDKFKTTGTGILVLYRLRALLTTKEEQGHE